MLAEIHVYILSAIDVAHVRHVKFSTLYETNMYENSLSHSFLKYTHYTFTSFVKQFFWVTKARPHVWPLINSTSNRLRLQQRDRPLSHKQSTPTSCKHTHTHCICLISYISLFTQTATFSSQWLTRKQRLLLAVQFKVKMRKTCDLSKWLISVGSIVGSSIDFLELLCKVKRS